MNSNRSLQALFLQTTRLHFLRSHSLMGITEVHHGQGGLLVALKHKDGQTQKELANFMGRKPATMTVMIKRMEKNGLVRKEQDKEDQRTTRVYITKKGEEEYKKVRDIFEQMEEEMFSNFSAEEKIVFKRLLMQIQDNFLEKMPEVKLFCEKEHKK